MIACRVMECACTFTSADELIMHEKNVHRPPVNFEFKCTFPACIQIFSNLYGYTRHLKNHKFNPPLPVPTSSSSKEHEVNSGIDIPLKIRKTEDKTVNLVDQNDTIFESDLYHMRQSAVEFTLNLHQKANFSRNDVREIQKATQTLKSSISSLKIQKLTICLRNI